MTTTVVDDMVDLLLQAGAAEVNLGHVVDFYNSDPLTTLDDSPQPYSFAKTIENNHTVPLLNFPRYATHLTCTFTHLNNHIREYIKKKNIGDYNKLFSKTSAVESQDDRPISDMLVSYMTDFLTNNLTTLIDDTDVLVVRLDDTVISNIGLFGMSWSPGDNIASYSSILDDITVNIRARNKVIMYKFLSAITTSSIDFSIDNASLYTTLDDPADSEQIINDNAAFATLYVSEKSHDNKVVVMLRTTTNDHNEIIDIAYKFGAVLSDKSKDPTIVVPGHKVFFIATVYLIMDIDACKKFQTVLSLKNLTATVISRTAYYPYDHSSTQRILS